MKMRLAILAATSLSLCSGTCQNAKVEAGGYCPTLAQFRTLIQIARSHIVCIRDTDRLQFTTWASIDIDQDGLSEVILRDEANGCYAAFSMGGWTKATDPDMDFLGVQEPDGGKLEFCIGKDAIVRQSDASSEDYTDDRYSFLKDSKVARTMLVQAERVYDGGEYTFKPVYRLGGKKLPAGEGEAIAAAFDKRAKGIDDLHLDWQPIE